MNMSESGTYDVIIAGAGPAGATAGFLLSKSGLRVLLIDKKKFPREKVCGGLITHKTVVLLERVFGLTLNSLREHGIITYESDSYEIRSRDSLIARGTGRIPFRFINRQQYDHVLLGMARQAGAEVIEGERIVSLDVLRSSLTTETGRKAAARVIIGADGVNSRIRRSFPSDLFGREDWKEDIASSHEIVLNREDLPERIKHPVLYYGFVEYGYAWIFPNGEKAILGICGLKRKNSKDMLSLFREFLAAIDVCPDQHPKIISYVLPYGNFLPEPFFRNILLVGDAAGFADPLLGEGIFYAQRSAELAAGAIIDTFQKKDESNALLRCAYLESLHNTVFQEMIYAGKIQETLFKRLRHFGWIPLKIMMNVLGDRPLETVHGVRSYRWMKRRTNY